MRPSICFDPLGKWILPFPEMGTRGSHHCGPMELSHWDRCIKPGRRLHPAPEAMTHPTRAVTWSQRSGCWVTQDTASRAKVERR